MFNKNFSVRFYESFDYSMLVIYWNENHVFRSKDISDEVIKKVVLKKFWTVSCIETTENQFMSFNTTEKSSTILEPSQLTSVYIQRDLGRISHFYFVLRIHIRKLNRKNNCLFNWENFVGSKMITETCDVTDQKNKCTFNCWENTFVNSGNFDFIIPFVKHSSVRGVFV